VLRWGTAGRQRIDATLVTNLPFAGRMLATTCSGGHGDAISVCRRTFIVTRIFTGLAVFVSVVAVACSTADTSRQPARSASSSRTSSAGSADAGSSPTTTATHTAAQRRLLAVVTAETEHAVLAVSTRTGRAVRRARVVGDPTTLAADPEGPVVVVSPDAGAVTILSWPGLSRLAVLRGFRSPQIAAVTPDGEWALVSDAATGDVSTIELADDRVVDRVHVGYGAHHIAVSPNQRSAWIALGETADSIVRLDLRNPGHLRIVGRLQPSQAAHDLAFAPNGATVWVTSAAAPDVSVYSAHTGRLLTTVPAGPAPQHVTFSEGPAATAYITSGYGSMIEMVNPTTHRVARRAAIPYGSFNLSTLDNVVATTSLLNGTVTILSRDLRRRLEAAVAPEAREIVLLHRR
jgi:DNA-binding beta-propeller fold protein YncE